MIGWMFDQAVAWLLGFTRNTLNTVWRLLASTLFHLPDVTGLPQVAALSSRSLTLVNTGFVVVIMAAGIVVMARDTVGARYGAAELAPRLVIAFIAANFATPICHAFITTANALVLALTGEGIASDRTLSQLLRVLVDALTNPTAALLVTLVGLVIDVLVLMLLIGWIARFAALIVAVGLAPAALACHALPWTETIAQAWWRTMGGLAATVVLQAVALHTSLAIFLDPATNLPSYGLPNDSTGLLNLIIIAVLLWVTVRIPSLVRRHLTHANTRPNFAAAIVRLVIVHQLTRGLGTALGRALRPAGRAGGAGGAVPGLGRSGGPGRPPAGGAPPARPIGPRPTRPGAPPATGTAQPAPGGTGHRPGPAPSTGSGRAPAAPGTGAAPLPPRSPLPSSSRPATAAPRTAQGGTHPRPSVTAPSLQPSPRPSLLSVRPTTGPTIRPTWHEPGRSPR
jgi:hypothetical protein